MRDKFGQNYGKFISVSRTTAIPKTELFMTLVKGFQSLIHITNSSILDEAGVLDRPLKFE